MPLASSHRMSTTLSCRTAGRSSCSSSSLPLSPLKDLWLIILGSALFDLRILPLLLMIDWLLTLLFARLSDKIFTSVSNRRLDVGYLEIDLVIPRSLRKSQKRRGHKYREDSSENWD
ncbi:hypothetical protein MLD38_001080 [Melastoma candidum]|uniref:Uncharacterized protein n=1 Tax=Melastoma candidum TaxID=119954 RepID=A0ACB9SC52_9MYRT|nr:hypothetical protein MLD38_001080 [Melastoma candidum]